MQTETNVYPNLPTPQDLYEVLQVSPRAEQDVIEAAYKRLAQKYHPDLNPHPDNLPRMQELNAAYAVLRDAQKREQYDLERANPILGDDLDINYDWNNPPFQTTNRFDFSPQKLMIWCGAFWQLLNYSQL